MVAYCNSTNSANVAQEAFWDPDGTINWDAHRIGWAVAGACAAACTLVSLVNVTLHASHYQNRDQQRQVIRVLLMPMVYAIVSFFSYRFFRDFTYYAVAEAAYESICLSAFMMLMVHMVIERSKSHAQGYDEGQDRIENQGIKGQDHTIIHSMKRQHLLEEALQAKDKRKMPFPFGMIRFRASKPYFVHAVKWSVLQYVILRPLISIIGIICEAYNVLCPDVYSVHFAEVYLDVADFISLSVALYGLIVFYVLCKDELKGRKPLAKFMAIKMIVFFTFYQSWLFGILQDHGVIKGTALWTATNVADGLSALCTCIEMFIFALYMLWAYPYKEYTQINKVTMIKPAQRETGWKTFAQAWWDTINLSDFAVEIWDNWVFFFDYMRGKPETRSKNVFDQAFTAVRSDEVVLKGSGLSRYDSTFSMSDPYSYPPATRSPPDEDDHFGNTPPTYPVDFVESPNAERYNQGYPPTQDEERYRVGFPPPEKGVGRV